MQEPESKPFLDHLEDLRDMLLKSAAALGIGMAACFFATKPIMEILLHPLRAIGEDPKNFLRVLGVIDPFSIQINISLFGGAILALPFILYYIGQFVLPALTDREKKFLLPAFTAGAVLFIGGVMFCYFVLMPKTLRFFLDYSAWMGVESQWTLSNYISFTVQMLLAFGISFELPLVLLILNVFGLVSSAFLSEKRRHAAVVIVIFAACITPTSDFFSLALLSVPMYLLYEACVWITLFREKKQR
jgi:sec-independent protein translocase protein TatC